MNEIWKNLDKIATQLKKASAKVLMLDFDGTLAPIAKSPKETKLPVETRDLLQKLCTKPNFYLAIISGRSLKNIKEKVGLPNIIYGGGHGLEGEILGEKYSFPLTGKTILSLENIQKKLGQISNQFKGIIIENKDLSLSFHYRLADIEQLPKIISLFNTALKPYIEKKLVVTAAGKKVIDIVPNVNWNKGHFAALIIRKLTDLIKIQPVAIVIGDDTTDENVFRKLKNQITITVGKKRQSGARYYLKNTGEVLRFLKWAQSMP